MRPARAVYPGTHFPIIRGGAPEAPPSGGDGKPAAAAPAGGGPPSPAAGAPPSGETVGAAPPARNWEKDYADLESRYKQYEKYGKPEQIDAFVAQAQTNKQYLDKIAKDFEEGRITYAQAKQQADAVQNADPFDGYENLEPREQANRLLTALKSEFGEFTKSELKKIQDEVKTTGSNLSTQMKLAWKLLQTARANPDVDLDTIIQESTQAAGYTPEQIIDLIVEKQSAPKRQQQAIDEAVAKAKAEWQREQDAKKVPPTTRTMPRLMPKEKPLSTAEKHDRQFNSFTDRLNAALAKQDRGAA